MKGGKGAAGRRYLDQEKNNFTSVSVLLELPGRDVTYILTITAQSPRSGV